MPLCSCNDALCFRMIFLGKVVVKFFYLDFTYLTFNKKLNYWLTKLQFGCYLSRKFKSLLKCNIFHTIFNWSRQTKLMKVICRYIAFHCLIFLILNLYVQETYFNLSIFATVILYLFRNPFVPVKNTISWNSSKSLYTCCDCLHPNYFYLLRLLDIFDSWLKLIR